MVSTQVSDIFDLCLQWVSVVRDEIHEILKSVIIEKLFVDYKISIAVVSFSNPWVPDCLFF